MNNNSDELFREWLTLAQESKDVLLLSKLNELSEVEKITLFSQQNLKFGTAGVRAKVGIGPALLNEYNIFRLGLAYADYLAADIKEKGIVVLHDTRLYSDEFSKVFLKAFTKAGLKKIYVYKNNDAAITPLISYFIRKMKLGGGIMITASHNPPGYQGVKFYNSQGIQIADNAAKAIEDQLKLIKPMAYAHLKEKNIGAIPNSYEKEYYLMLKKLYQANRMNKNGSKIKVLLTTLQGAGAPFIEKLKQKLQLNISFVKSEKNPDKRFSHAKSTNPEDFDRAYNNALKEADTDEYDVLVAIDPDADRLGIIDFAELKKIFYSESNQNLQLSDLLNCKKPWCLSGNKVSALLLEHVLHTKSKKTKNDKLSGFVVRSYVTSDFVDLIGSHYGIKTYETFTGFKWIGQKVESIKDAQVIMGFEESIGYFFSNDAREKDSLQALVVLISLLERLKKRNLTLTDHLHNLFQKYRTYVDETDNIYVKINYEDFLNIIKNIEASNLVKTKKLSVEYIKHPYEENIINLVRLKLSDGSGWIAMRPSGTEPKIKTYYIFNGDSETEIKKKIGYYKDNLTAIVNEYITNLSSN